MDKMLSAKLSPFRKKLPGSSPNFTATQSPEKFLAALPKTFPPEKVTQTAYLWTRFDE